jgi:hypothetical protein
MNNRGVCYGGTEIFFVWNTTSLLSQNSSNATLLMVEVIAIKIIRWSSQLGWPLRNIHISNYNGYFTFYVDVFFPPSLPRLLSDLTVHMNNTAGVLYQAKTACPSRAPELTPSALEGVSVAHLFIFLFCPIMCLYVLSSGLGCPLRFPLNKYAWLVFASSYL